MSQRSRDESESLTGAAQPGRKSLLDAPTGKSARPVLVGGLSTFVFHACVFGGALWMASLPRPKSEARAAVITELFEVELDRPKPEPPPEVAPPPEPEPPPPPPVEKVKAQKPAPEPKVEPPPEPKAEEPPPPTPAEPPPAAAEAAQVLTQEASAQEPNAPGDTIVQGTSEAYAGGVTQAGGTSKTAVRDENARAGGVEGGKGDTLVDRSRPARLAAGRVWDCPLPEEAEYEGIDSAVVTLEIEVAADGTLKQVAIKKDPGYGFGREARRCALSKKWEPALDRTGKPIAMKQLVNVRF